MVHVEIDSICVAAADDSVSVDDVLIGLAGLKATLWVSQAVFYSDA